MSTTVRIPGPLRRYTDNADKVQVDAGNLVDVINQLNSLFPGIQDRLLDDAGEMRYFVNVYLNGEDVRFLQGLQTPIKDGDEVSIVPPVAGGSQNLNQDQFPEETETIIANVSFVAGGYSKFTADISLAKTTSHPKNIILRGDSDDA